MRKRIFLCLLGVALPAALAGAIASGCGTTVDQTPPGGGGAGGGGGSSTTGNPGAGGTPSDAGRDALDDYVDPGCPDAGPKITMFACDPYHQQNGQCPPSQGCYIFVQYPAMPCGQEILTGAACQPAGSGMQGTPCGGASNCGAGLACVVSGSGNQCVELCPLVGESGCPAGLVCEPIDVAGFGGCL